MTALALKYRPSTFDDLVGQLHAATSLRNAITHGKVSHAYLFFGSRGVGKTSTARILARSLNCVKGPTVTPCGECENCLEIPSGNSIDVIEMDAASNRGIEHVRALRESVGYAPMKSNYKIYIIDEVHMLTNESFNALLKTLEEPPAHVVFILATTEYHKIPETILSRCQSFAFKKFLPDEIAGRLKFILEKEKVSFDERAIKIISHRAEGSMRDSISLLDQVMAYAGRDSIKVEDVSQVLGALSVESYLRLLESVRTRNLKDALMVIDELHREGANLKRFLWDFIDFIKNMVLLKSGIPGEIEDLFSEQELSEIKNIAANWDAIELHAAYDRFYRLYSSWSIFQTTRSSEIRVSLEMAFVELFHTLNSPSVSSLVKKIAGLKSVLEQGGSFTDETGSIDVTSSDNTRTTPARDKQAPAEHAQETEIPVEKKSQETSTGNIPQQKNTVEPQNSISGSQAPDSIPEKKASKPSDIQKTASETDDIGSIIQKEFTATEDESIKTESIFNFKENEE